MLQLVKKQFLKSDSVQMILAFKNMYTKSSYLQFFQVTVRLQSKITPINA